MAQWSEPLTTEAKRLKAYATDDANFQPILPLPLAERLRPWLYALGIALALASVSRVMHLGPINWPATLIGLAAIAVVYWWCSPREAPRQQAPARFPTAYTDETRRLVGDGVEWWPR